jgi:hypothetical protein
MNIDGLLKTFPKRYQFVILAAFVYISWPISEFLFYYENQVRRVYPSNADSIGIPIFETLESWIFVFPVFILFNLFCLNRYLGNISLYELPKIWNWKIILVHLCFAFFGAVLLQQLYWDIADDHIASIINTILAFWYLLHLRIIFSQQNKIRHQTPIIVIGLLIEIMSIITYDVASLKSNPIILKEIVSGLFLIVMISAYWKLSNRYSVKQLSVINVVLAFAFSIGLNMLNVESYFSLFSSTGFILFSLFNEFGKLIFLAFFVYESLAIPTWLLIHKIVVAGKSDKEIPNS